jgi:antirestriction protein ArdC
MSSFDLYQTVTDQIVAMLEAGVVPWRSPILGRSKAGHPRNLNTGGDRHGIGKHGEEMKSAREREARFRV